MENATPNEFIEFQKAFRKAGYETEIAEIRELKYSDGTLKTPDGKKIDAIYRRAVTCDIMRNTHYIQPFLQAVREGAVCLIGHFRTQIIHNKAVFKILRAPETQKFLTEREREYVKRHIPETFTLTKENAFGTLKNKDEWIIKPEDLYGARGVFAGADMDAAAWKKAVTEAADTGYLLQRYCPPYKSENIDFNNGGEFKMYNNIMGMFIYNGKLQGLYSRAGLLGTISAGTRGLTLASLYEAK